MPKFMQNSNINKIAYIRSGGQSGVDRAALDAARQCGIPITGWVPKGGWAEDFTEPPGITARYPELRETPDTDVSQRTVWNVRDAQATLVILSGTSPGTNLTIETAQKMSKPMLVADSDTTPEEIANWIGTLGEEIELNIGGPRESESPGIYESTKKLLIEVFGMVQRGSSH